MAIEQEFTQHPLEGSQDNADPFNNDSSEVAIPSSIEAYRLAAFTAAAGAALVAAALLEKNFGWISDAYRAFVTSPQHK